MTETGVLAEATVTYQPKTGGIHPREAASTTPFGAGDNGAGACQQSTILREQ
ncbi:MAG: hypothetical protein U9N46_04330 [Euryarchaeota archaeon]|nr:hypothetical protein [Euryarchaeota archaeon]